jgi:Fic family protein
MPVYVHHSKKGPDFVWDQGKIAGLLAEVRYKQGRLFGRMEGLETKFWEEARQRVYSDDAQTSDGEDRVRFSDMILESARQYAVPLTKEGLFRWHAELYPEAGKTEEKAAEKTASRAKVHFQPSAGEGLEGKLNKLIHWVNSPTETDPVIKAAVAQLWLVMIRPFETGNERLAELVMEGLLARSNESGKRFYSVTGRMRAETREYDAILSGTVETSPDATGWIEWFLGCMGRAIDNAGEELRVILNKDRFWKRCAGMALNGRQRMILEKLLDGKESKLTSSKWALQTNTSQDTAGRDINDLVRLGLLTRQAGGGRSTSYRISPEI